MNKKIIAWYVLIVAVFSVFANLLVKTNYLFLTLFITTTFDVCSAYLAWGILKQKETRKRK